MMVVRFLKKVGFAGKDHNVGDLAEVDRNTAKILILHNIVEEK